MTGASSSTVDGTLTTQNGSINASDSSRVEINALNGTSGGLTLDFDGTSTIEIGGQDVGTAGSITIDLGVSFTESGTFSAPVIADNGTITVAPSTSLTLDGNASSRGLTGSGTVNIDKGSSLTLNGVDPGTSDAVTIDFAQTGGQLWLESDDFDALGNVKPAITGFGATDVIEYQGTATSATYASGYLSLYNGANLVAKFNIGSGYTGHTFSTVAISGGYTQVDLAGTPNAAPAGTASANSYQWVGPVAGFWNAKANWDDVTAVQDPATAAPGANDLVSIGAAANGAAQVVIGNGDAYSLSLGGETLLEGQFNVGAGGFSESNSASVVLYSGSALNVAGNATFGNYAGATLDGGVLKLTGTGTLNGGYDSQFVMENGGSLSAVKLVDYYSSYSVQAGSALTVRGGVNDGTAGYGASSFTINGGAFTVGGTFVSTGDSVYAESGGTVQLASLTEDSDGNGVTLDVEDFDLVDRDRNDGRRRGGDDHHRRGPDGYGGRELLCVVGDHRRQGGFERRRGAVAHYRGNPRGRRKRDHPGERDANPIQRADRRRHGDHRRRREAEPDLQLDRDRRHDCLFRHGRTAGDQQL